MIEPIGRQTTWYSTHCGYKQPVTIASTAASATTRTRNLLAAMIHLLFYLKSQSPSHYTISARVRLTV